MTIDAGLKPEGARERSLSKLAQARPRAPMPDRSAIRSNPRGRLWRVHMGMCGSRAKFSGA